MEETRRTVEEVLRENEEMRKEYMAKIEYLETKHEEQIREFNAEIKRLSGVIEGLEVCDQMQRRERRRGQMKTSKDLIDRLRTYASTRKGELAELITEAADALERQTCEDAVSRAAAINAVKKNTFRLTFAEEQGCEGHVVWSAYAVYSDVMEGALLELPSAQPQITHCAECIHWKHSDVRKNYCEVFDWTNTAEDFCSFAERKDTE